MDDDELLGCADWIASSAPPRAPKAELIRLAQAAGFALTAADWPRLIVACEI